MNQTSTAVEIQWFYKNKLVSRSALFAAIWSRFDMQEAASCRTSNTFPPSSIATKIRWKQDRLGAHSENHATFVPLWWNVCRSCSHFLRSAHISVHGASRSAPSPGFSLPLSGWDLELWTADRQGEHGQLRGLNSQYLTYSFTGASAASDSKVKIIDENPAPRDHKVEHAWLKTHTTLSDWARDTVLPHGCCVKGLRRKGG